MKNKIYKISTIYEKITSQNKQNKVTSLKKKNLLDFKIYYRNGKRICLGNCMKIVNSEVTCIYLRKNFRIKLTVQKIHLFDIRNKSDYNSKSFFFL